VCVYSHVYLAVDAGGELCEVWFFLFQNIPDWDKTAMSRGESI